MSERRIGLFVTGTDTGVGKTVVAGALAQLLRRQGRYVAVSKPVATGATPRGGRLVSDDTVRLAEAAGADDDDWEWITPFCYAEPAAPPVAARAAGGSAPSLAALVDAVNRAAPPEACRIVEGVGGLLCPLSDTHTIADLAAALMLPLVVVARRSLGTLNHTLLTWEAAQRRALPTAGVVISETTPPHSRADETNVDELRRRGVPVLAVVPYHAGADPEALASALAAVDWWRLAGGAAPTDEETAASCRP